MILSAAKENGYLLLLDGTNASDVEGDRPGMKVCKELEVRSPLREAGLTKDEIRRLSKEKSEALEEIIAKEPEHAYKYHDDARIATIGKAKDPDGIGTIDVATGGTSDIPAAEEVAVTAEFHGNSVKRIYDVGVAGLHRLLSYDDEIMSASVIVAIAGMEGALASVIGGLSDCPVIAVPTSVGYGASFQGLSALLSMLNSCASGVSVVNIDNGFGAGYLAGMINHMDVKNNCRRKRHYN